MTSLRAFFRAWLHLHVFASSSVGSLHYVEKSRAWSSRCCGLVFHSHMPWARREIASPEMDWKRQPEAPCIRWRSVSLYKVCKAPWDFVLCGLCKYFVHLFIHSFIHSFVRSFVRSFIYSFIHSFIHLFVRSFVRSFVHSFIHSFICSFVRSFVRSFIHSFIYSFIRSFVRSLVRSFVRSFIHSFVHLFVRSFIYSFIHSSFD